LTERRSYKQAMTSGEAMAVLQAMSGKVEPGFLQAFGRAVARAA
jgi:HD-GYP domain-containing protein (c-di-GMP phosphodiesterase class II)